ncbi:MAG: YebC/PmpR family DNA-binding transcriptional regulator [Deltaproteobacteria bacterium]|nr:YebC/PmpR family DNA-binding transcriptional regulator [Deltaproteobacteria bacterium]MBW2170634.1 YebC/PmpR family DNA-binding transcriptional regulator [Deltaproteobacteria bacterium]
MSGHSKWSTIKRKKGATDAKRGKAFTKLIKEITVAARMGGGDPNANPRLRTAIAAAKTDNMPKDNIERAIKKGTGALEGVSYEEVYYEGYGPGGAAVLVESFTDNKNRTVADVRHMFSKSGGGLGEAGCVAWMFEKKGLFVFQKEGVDEETLMEAILDAGGEDIRDEETTFEVTTAPDDFEAVKKALDDRDLKYELAEVTMVPKSTVRLEDKEAEQMLRLMESLEDSDDVQKVYSNFDISEEALEKIGGA